MTKRIGRPPRICKDIVSTATRIEDAAAVGASIVGIARALDVHRSVLTRWLETHPELQQAYERGRAREEQALRNALFKGAMNGNIVAAIFLLKARHGWKEATEATNDTRSVVNIIIKAASTAATYRPPDLIEGERS